MIHNFQPAIKKPTPQATIATRDKQASRATTSDHQSDPDSNLYPNLYQQFNQMKSMSVQSLETLEWPSEIVQSFIISMRPDKCRVMQQRLGPWSQHINIWPATNGYQIDKESWKTQEIVSRTSTLTRGQIGCYDSHVKIWQYMVDENIPLALIMEDDADLQYQPSHARILRQCFDQLKTYSDSWDLMYLGRGKQIDWPANTHTNVLPSMFSRPRGCCGLFCYLVTLTGAQKLLSHARPYFYPIDLLVARLHDTDVIQAISLKQRLCFVWSLESDTNHIK
jgi:glycosyl transferase family 25